MGIKQEYYYLNKPNILTKALSNTILLLLFYKNCEENNKNGWKYSKYRIRFKETQEMKSKYVVITENICYNCQGSEGFRSKLEGEGCRFIIYFEAVDNYGVLSHWFLKYFRTPSQQLVERFER